MEREELGSADFIYNNVSGNNASSLVSMGADTCGTDLVVSVNSNSALMPADNTDTIVATSGILMQRIIMVIRPLEQ